MGLFDWFGRKGRRERFAQRVMARLRERDWPHPIGYDPESFTLDLGGEAGAVALHRTFHEWSRHPGRGRPEVLDEAIAFIFDLGPPPPFETAASMLRPMIRSRATLEAALCEDGAPADLRNAWKPLGEHLTIHVGIDRPSSLTLVLEQTLKDWGRSFDECLEIAVANLRGADPVQFESHADGFHFIVSGDHNDVARLLTPEVFASLSLRGDPVVVAACRRCLVVAGSEDHPALEALARFVPAFLADESWPLSYAPMVLRAGQWRAFEPPSRQSAIADLHLLQKLFGYADQRPLMANMLSRQGRSEEIANLTLFPTDQGQRILALWEAPRVLLPRADFVVLRRGKGQTFVRAWEDVETACGGFPIEAPMNSPYHVVSDWPDAEAMARIEAAPEPDWAKGRGFGIANGRLTVFG